MRLPFAIVKRSLGPDTRETPALAIPVLDRWFVPGQPSEVEADSPGILSPSQRYGEESTRPQRRLRRDSRPMRAVPMLDQVRLLARSPVTDRPHVGSRAGGDAVQLVLRGIW